MSEAIHIDENLLEDNNALNPQIQQHIHLQGIKQKRKNYSKVWDLNQI